MQSYNQSPQNINPPIDRPRHTNQTLTHALHRIDQQGTHPPDRLRLLQVVHVPGEGAGAHHAGSSAALGVVLADWRAPLASPPPPPLLQKLCDACSSGQRACATSRALLSFALKPWLSEARALSSCLQSIRLWAASTRRARCCSIAQNCAYLHTQREFVFSFPCQQP
jgi:hypothetical protein